MSKHAKKMKRMADWGLCPEIGLDDQTYPHESWLYWEYQLAPWSLRVEISLNGEARAPWLFVDGDDCELDDEATRTHAEATYGAITRVRLLEAHAEEIRNVTTREAGLVRLKEAATAAGLFGKREPRRCVVPTWTTLDQPSLP